MALSRPMSMPDQSQPSLVDNIYIYIYLAHEEARTPGCIRHVANHVALVQYAMPGKNAQFYTRARLTSIYVLIPARRNPLKSFKTCLGLRQDRGNKQRTFGDKTGRKTRERERKGTLFTLRYIERQVYTQNYVSLPRWCTASSMR